jgi:hypothetical protein
MSELLTCNNCAYEIDEASKIGLCDNCQRAYELGERESELYATAYGLVSAEELNKIEGEANY